MLRIRSNVVKRFLKSQEVFNHATKRNMSSSNAGPNPVVFVAAASVVGVAATSMYSRSNDEFRQKLKSNLPTFLAENEFLLGASKKDLSLPYQNAIEANDSVEINSSDVESKETISIVETVADEIAAIEDSSEKVSAEENSNDCVEQAAEQTIEVVQESEVVSEAPAVQESEVVSEAPAIQESEVGSEAPEIQESVVCEKEEVEAVEEKVAEVTQLSEEVAPITESTAEIVQISEEVVEPVVENIAEVAEIKEEVVEPVVENIAEVAEIPEEVVQPVVENIGEVAEIPVAVEPVSEPLVVAAVSVDEIEPLVEAIVEVNESAAESSVDVHEAIDTEEIKVDDQQAAAAVNIELNLEELSSLEEAKSEESFVVTKEDTLAEASVEEFQKQAVNAEAELELKKLAENEAENSATSTILQAFLSRGHSACEVAIEVGDQANKLAENYVALLKNLLNKNDASKEEISDLILQLEESAPMQSAVVQKAVDLHIIAEKELAQVENVLSHVQEDSLLNYEESKKSLVTLKKQLSESNGVLSSNVDEIASNGRIISFCRKMIGSEPLSFLQLPEEEYVLSGKNFTSNELRQIVLHTQNYLASLKQQVVDERSKFNEKLNLEIEAACLKTEEAVKMMINEEMNEKIVEMQLEFEKKQEKLHEVSEEDTKHQLKQQAAAHVLHLADALKYLQDQLDEKYEGNIKSQLESQKEKFEGVVTDINEKYQNEIREMNEEYALRLSAAKGRLEGLEFSIDGRAIVDNYIRNANELMLACDSLSNVIRTNTAESASNPTSIKNEVEKVLQVSQGDETLQAIVGQIPTEVIKGGVYTENALRTSFKNISKLCCKLSLVSEKHNSLFTYMLSYLKSLLIVNPEESKPPSQVDASKLDVFQIVQYANYCLQRGQVEQAARLVNQLKGEPKNVVSSWLQEVRLHLETIHALDALTTLSSAVLCGAHSESATE